MTDLKPFQEATVKAVLAAFDKRRRTRRFLVADEVGLGKTVVAQHVIQRMFSGLQRPLVVFYMCSNLAIARQNRRKLLEVLPSEERAAADCPVDRLSLLGTLQRSMNSKLQLFTLTPDTSIPIRKKHRRDGRREERALVHNLIDLLWPGLFDDWGIDVFQGSATVNWQQSITDQRKNANKAELREGFRRSVREEFQLTAGRHLLPELRARREKSELDKLALIAHFRNALAASAIDEFRPDLVIFDEFQRFRDLLDSHQSESAQRVIGRLRGDESSNHPALLLLSATPYRLFTRRSEEESGASHRTEFFELIKFLYGGDVAAQQKSKECVSAFAQFETELRKGTPTSDLAKAARLRTEKLLCPIIARTERAAHGDGWDIFHTKSLPAPVSPEDLSIFKHLSRSFDESHRSSAVPYWTSIPLPMQTMGSHYVAWKSAGKISGDGTPALTKTMRDGFEQLAKWPHPRLRSLKDLVPTERLAVPWLAPTSSWWPLRGAWKDREQLPRKVLVFSRFRAVPQAIAAATSFDLESRFLGDEKLKYSEVSKRRLLSPSDTRHPLLGLFHTSPFLINSTDPLEARSADLRVIRQTVRRQLKKALGGLGIKVRKKAPALPIWRLLARLEYAAGNWGWVSEAWLQVHEKVVASDPEHLTFKNLWTDWNQEAAHSLKSIRYSTFEALVDYALGSPGVVVGRSLRRHWPDATSDVYDKRGRRIFRHTFAASWIGLRNYLDQRWFYRLLCKSDETYPDAILRAVVDGNLEAVLDEHLWITSRLRNLSGKELANELQEGLTIKSGTFFLHPLEGKKENTFSLRCHVAMPFIQSQVKYSESGEKPIRTDEMRRAFNTPFWPYVLATTSVGQEGLDLSTWCDTLVHWDLCRNPVDLEQREGRIQRFGGLAIRRAIALKLRDKAMLDRDHGESPWSRIESIANETMSDASGLEPWWVCKDGNVKRYIFDVPTSEQKHWFQWVKEQRRLYRLALGQPNQEDLVNVLSTMTDMDQQAIRAAVINLSPWFRDIIRKERLSNPDK